MSIRLSDGIQCFRVATNSVILPYENFVAIEEILVHLYDFWSKIISVIIYEEFIATFITLNPLKAACNFIVASSSVSVADKGRGGRGL